MQKENKYETNQTNKINREDNKKLKDKQEK